MFFPEEAVALIQFERDKIEDIALVMADTMKMLYSFY